MAKILPLSTQPPAKLGFERVKKRKKKDPEGHGQLNLFIPKESSARIVSLPSRFGHFEEALLLDERGDNKARELYLKAIEADDCTADAYCNLGILESRSGKITEAFDCFSKSLELDSRHLESHYNLGNLYFEMDNLRLARQHYEIAAKIDPMFPNIYFNLGLVFAITDNLESAVRALEQYKNLVSEEEADKADDLVANLKLSLD